MNRASELGWTCVATHDPAGRRGLWYRIVKANREPVIELCAGREGDDAYFALGAGHEVSREKVYELAETLDFARHARELTTDKTEDRMTDRHAEAEAWIKKLGDRAWRVHSQDGEEGIVETIFEGLGMPTERPSAGPRVAVDIGAGDGHNLSNTRFLVERGWRVLMIDGREPASDGVVQAMVTRDNVNEILSRYLAQNSALGPDGSVEVPVDFDFLSLDIDGVDLHVWRALQYRPKVISVEFNGVWPIAESVTVPYDEKFRHDGTTYYGASLAAMVKLGRLKGYTLVHQHHAVNAFFVRRDLLPPGFTIDVPFEPRRYHSPDTLDRPWEKF